MTNVVAVVKRLLLADTAIVAIAGPEVLVAAGSDLPENRPSIDLLAEGGVRFDDGPFREVDLTVQVTALSYEAVEELTNHVIAVLDGTAVASEGIAKITVDSSISNLESEELFSRILGCTVLVR